MFFLAHISSTWAEQYKLYRIYTLEWQTANLLAEDWVDEPADAVTISTSGIL